MSVSAVCVDDGEPNLERCLRSLLNQTVGLKEIIVAAGPRTDLELARSLASRVQAPVEGIGKARVKAILSAESPYILSVDSDSVYDSRYAEFALEGLRNAKAVKAGVILPLEWNHPLVLLETVMTLVPPYEFALAFRKQAFLDANIHLDDYSNLRMDIGGAVVNRLNAWPNYHMVCWTRMPTKGAYEFSEKYLLSAVAGATPILAVSSIPLAVTLASHV